MRNRLDGRTAREEQFGSLNEAQGKSSDIKIAIDADHLGLGEEIGKVKLWDVIMV